MNTATGECHVCGSEAVPIHLLATCDRCRAAAGHFPQQPNQVVVRKPRRSSGGHATWAETFCCSFCGRTPEQVRKIFSGPWSFICDGCVALASEVMHEALGDDWNPLSSPPAGKPGGKTLSGHGAATSGGGQRGGDWREVTAVGRPQPAAARGAGTGNTSGNLRRTPPRPRR